MSELHRTAHEQTTAAPVPSAAPAVPAKAAAVALHPARTGVQPLPAYASVQPLTDAQYQTYEAVLAQPETKKTQRLFLKHLCRPAHQIRFDFAHPDAPDVLRIQMTRPRKGEAAALQFDVPAGRRAQVIVAIEADGAAPEMARADKPALLIDAAVARDASLDVVCIHPLSAGIEGGYLRRKHATVCLYRGRVASGGLFKWTSFNLGDSLVEKGLVDLSEPHASADLGGASYVPAGAEQSYQSHIRCLHPGGNARVHNHGVVEDGGVGTFISVSDIAKGARGTVAREDNRFITLGERARAFADPTLLIEEYDVRASHAATVGQMDADTMFYLCSRGLTPEMAKRLVTVGFLAPLFDRVPQSELRDHLLSALSDQVHQGVRG